MSADLKSTVVAMLERSGPIPATKLHALLYYAQAWNLALAGPPVFDSAILADAAGPRIADLPVPMEDEVVVWAHEGQAWHVRCPVSVADPDMVPLLGAFTEQTRVGAVFGAPSRSGPVSIVGMCQRVRGALVLAGFVLVDADGKPGPDLVRIEAVDSFHEQQAA